VIVTVDVPVRKGKRVDRPLKVAVQTPLPVVEKSQMYAAATFGVRGMVQGQNGARQTRRRREALSEGDRNSGT
jgi:hypothetical protein